MRNGVQPYARRNVDGLAVIGRTLHDLRGIRFEDGEDGNVPGDSGDSDTPDVSVLQAKIDELTGVIAARDASIADLGAQLVASKAANYDLLMAVGTDDTDNVDTDVSNDQSEVTIDDLFGEDSE